MEATLLLAIDLLVIVTIAKEKQFFTRLCYNIDEEGIIYIEAINSDIVNSIVME